LALGIFLVPVSAPDADAEFVIETGSSIEH
jgi:hypothetical protein